MSTLFPRAQPARVYYLLSAGLALLGATMFTTYSVYYVRAVGLNPLQLVLVGTTLEAAYLLLEMPTGVVADAYSRRASVILGTLLLGAGFLVVGLWARFAAVLLRQVLSAAGYAFLSGALEAWLTDEVGPSAVSGILVRGGQYERLATLAGVGLSIGLTSLSLNWGFIAGGLGHLALSGWLLLAMPEEHFTPRPRQAGGAWGNLWQTLQAGARLVRGRPVLLMLVSVQLFVGAASEGFDRLGDAHLLTNFSLPALGGLQVVAWFGVIRVAHNLLSLGTTYLLRHRLEAATRAPAVTARWLLALNGLTVLSTLAFALTRNFPLAFAALMLKGIAAALIHPLYTAWLVQNIESDVRATVISMTGQTNAVGQIVVGPGVGWVGQRVSLRAALTVASLLLLPALPLYARAGRAENTARHETD